MKTYADLTTIKSALYLNITGTDNDTAIRKLLEAASAEIDNFTHRHFNIRSETRYYDGDFQRLFLFDDVLSITTLKLDLDGDGVYETTFAGSDYRMIPLNSYPKTRLEIAYGGDYSDFGQLLNKAVEIAGVFGYGDGISAAPYSLSGGTLGAAVASTTTTTVTMTVGHSVAAGHTIRIDSEDMYVETVSSNTLTVRRGEGGTTAALHDNGKTVYIHEYPSPVTQACLIQASRLKKRGESAYANVISNEVTGETVVYKGLDPDVKQMLTGYVRGPGGMFH